MRAFVPLLIEQGEGHRLLAAAARSTAKAAASPRVGSLPSFIAYRDSTYDAMSTTSADVRGEG